MNTPPYDDFVTAACSRTQAALLVQFDHHRVQVDGRWGILISHHLMPLEGAPDPLTVIVVFNPSRKHLPSENQARGVVFQHPLVPPHVQLIVDDLVFG